MDDRRKHPRVEIDESAYISASGLSMRCRLLNMSADGAAVEVPNPAFVPSHFQLMTEKDRVIRHCRVIWIKQNRIGVTFDQPGAEDGSTEPGSNP
ncbi:PilZ domain-containing protein [Nitrobacter sp. NHB1]|uniref:PilZ domain-containing protein n=1 Tax=Nitrobacter sp. NHB1 TaxID=3119830 RepID=UPI002FFF0456